MDNQLSFQKIESISYDFILTNKKQIIIKIKKELNLPTQNKN